jgi:hypothetical protein
MDRSSIISNLSLDALYIGLTIGSFHDSLLENAVKTVDEDEADRVQGERERHGVNECGMVLRVTFAGRMESGDGSNTAAFER